MPPPPPIQAPPEPDFSAEDEAREAEAAEKERRRNLNRKGRRATILTGTGLTEIEEFNEKFNTTFEDTDFDTIAGYVMNKFGKFPVVNESIKLEKIKFTVSSANKKQINKLRVKV